MKEFDDNYSDDPIEPETSKGSVFSKLFSFAGIAALLVVGSTFASNINLNSGQRVEFGQGISIVTSCDSQIVLTPRASFVNASGSGSFYFSSFTLSNVDVTACNGVSFTLKAFGNTGSDPLTLFSTNNSAVINDSSTAFVVAANQSGLTLSDTSTSGAFTANFTSPVALASDVYKITIETSGNGTSSLSSVTVSAFTFTDIQTGNGKTCGLTSSETVWCWGQGTNGSLGNGDNQNSIYPVQVVGLTGISMISYSGSTGCALSSGGEVKCWGDGGNGTLGNGQNNITSSTPVSVQNISNAISIGITGSTACAVISGGTIKCWGYNYWGDAGNGTDGGNGANPTIPYSHIVDPTLVSGISNATYAIGGGCALLSTGAIKCWGYGANGQLGDGNNSINSVSKSNTPVSVTGISNATQISGSSTRCAVLNDNSIKCWGSNAYSALGNGATSSATPNPTPVLVSGIANATQVSVYGMNNACAVLSTGAIKCWGAYQGGMLGSNTNSDSSSPVVIAGISNATKVSVGDSHACAILSGGQVRCWGDNSYGQFGNGTTTSSSTPS